MIEKIPPIGHTQPVEKTTKREERVQSPSDQVEISAEAKEKLAIHEILQLPAVQKALSEPLIRQDKISLAKERLKKGFYQQHEGEVAAKVRVDLLG